jgi:hypothetical protein
VAARGADDLSASPGGLSFLDGADEEDPPMEIAEQIKTEAAALQQRWDSDARWAGIERPYSAEEVVRLRGRIRETQSFAAQAADKLWNLMTTEDFVRRSAASPATRQSSA